MKKKWWIPIITILLFSIESNFSNFFPAYLFSENWIFVPRFLLVFILLAAVYYDEKTAYVYAFTIGLVTDLVFVEIVGIYFFWYPATVYLITKLMKIVQTHFIIVTIASLLAISFFDFGIYAFHYALRITDMTVDDFISMRLSPTLWLNFIYYALIFYPTKNYFSKIKKQKEEEDGMFQT